MQKTLRLSAEAWIVGITLGAFGILTFAGNALATTTISANLDTDGTLTVDGAVTLGDAAADTVHYMANALTFEGATDDAFELTLGIGDQIADRTASIPVLAANDTFVMLAATQTLTGKSLTTPTITGTPTAAGSTWADLGTVTTIDINGGTVDGVTIGGASAGAGTFTTLTANGALTIGDAAADTVQVNANAITFEGATADDFELTLGIGDQTADRTASIPVLAANDTFVMLAATQTLTGKTLTSPTIGTSPTAAGATWADLGTVTTIDINGGTVDGATIGGTSAGAGTFTNLSSTGNSTLGDGVADTITLNGTMLDAGGSALKFEGATDNTFETFVVFTDPTDDRTITFPDANITVNAAANISGTTLAANVVTSSLTTLGTIASLVATTADINAGTFDGVVGGTTPAAGSFTTLASTGNTTLGDAAADVVTVMSDEVYFEGATDNTFETRFVFTDPTADRSITFPNASGTVVISGGNAFNFSDFTDSMSLDAATSVALGAFNYTFNLDSTGDFQVQDGGSNILHFNDADGVMTFSDDVVHTLGAGEFLQLDAASTASTTTAGVLDMNVAAGDAAVDGINLALTQNDGASAAVDMTAFEVALTGNDADGDVLGINIATLDTANAGAGTYEYAISINNLDTTAGSMPDAIIINSTGVNLGVTDAIDASAANIDNALNVGTNDIEGTTATITFTDFTVSADGIINSAPDADAASLTIEPSVAQTTAIDLDATNIDNAILIGANDIEGTTATITFTDFTVDADGKTTLANDTDTDMIVLNPGSALGVASDGIDATATNLDNALNIGANDIEGTTGTITFTDFTLDADGLVVFASDGAGDQITMTGNNADYQALVITTATASTNTSGIIDLNVTAADAAVDAMNIALVQSSASAAVDATGLNISLQGDDADGDMFGLKITGTATANAAAGTYDAGILIDNGENIADSMQDGIRITSTTDTAITDGLDVSDAEIVNALNVGANVILGTTPVINFNNFDVDASGNVTAVSLAAGGGTALTKITVGNLADGASGWTPDGAATTFTITADAASVGANSFIGVSVGANAASSVCSVSTRTAATSFVVQCSVAPANAATIQYMIVN